MSHDTQAPDSGATDNELAASAAGGDEAAFEELHRRHRHRVTQVCMTRLHNAEDAEDAAQETFAQVYRNIGSFRGESLFTTWLHRIAVNQSLTIIRRRDAAMRRGEMLSPDGDIELTEQSHPPARPPQPDLCLRMTLDAFAAQMPPRERAVFVMRAVLGYGHEQIAEALGIEAGTSKSQFHRARARLRLTLAGTPGTPSRRSPAA
jgi:RNA polymerase sigma-70 factor, ECF subfamily